MKRLLVFALFLMAATGLAETATACKINYDPKKVEGLVGEKKTIEVKLKWEHRRCVLDEYDIDMEFKGVSLIKQEGWSKIRSGLYKNVLTVRLDQPGEGTVRVYRECSKKGLSEGILKIKMNQMLKGALKDVAQITFDLDSILKKKSLAKKDKVVVEKLKARLEAERKWLLKNSPKTEEAKTLLTELDKIVKALKKKEFNPDLLVELKKHKLLSEDLKKIAAKKLKGKLSHGGLANE